MKTRALIMIILLLLAGSVAAETYTVSITAGGLFDPDYIEIEPGDKIRWENNDDGPHRVKADDGSFDSGRLNPGDSYTRTFSDIGTFGYYDSFHPSTTGTIKVLENAVLPLSWGYLRFLLY